MRPRMGMVASKTWSSSVSLPEFWRAVMPRVDSARLIDFVKLSGVVDGSRRSECEGQQRTHSTTSHSSDAFPHERTRERTISQLIHFDLVAALCRVQGSQRTDRPGAHDHRFLSWCFGHHDACVNVLSAGRVCPVDKLSSRFSANKSIVILELLCVSQSDFIFSQSSSLNNKK